MKKKLMNSKVMIAWILIISLFFSILIPPLDANAVSNFWDKQNMSETCCVYVGPDALITFKVIDQWENGYNASVNIYNTSEKTIDNWGIEMILGGSISDIWNAEIVNFSNDIYSLTNLGWNQDILPQESIEFGFKCMDPFDQFPDIKMKNNILSESSDSDYTCKCTITSDWESGYTGNIEINNISGNRINEWLLSFELEDEISYIWNAEIIEHELGTYVIKGLEYNQNIESGQKLEIGFVVDNGIIRNKPHNMKLCQQNPYETEMSIIPIPEEDYFKDFDEDGVPNLLEYWFGLNPNEKDSNNNGCSDYDGLIAYFKTELAGDTDEDGISDYMEVLHGLNPCNPCTFQDGINDGDRFLNVKRKGAESDLNGIIPEVQINLKGNQLDSFDIEKIEDPDPFLNSTIPGYLANAYDLFVDGDFEEAILSFDIPEEITSNSEIIPSIYYWNEQTQMLEELEDQYIQEDKICAKLSHFSSYILLNKAVFEKVIVSFDILAPVDVETLNASIRLVLALDESGSISNYNFSVMKNSSYELIEKLGENDKVALFTFDGQVRKICSFMDVSGAARFVKGVTQHRGMTAIKDAVLSAINEIDTSETKDSSNIIVMLTDGYSNSDNTLLSYEEIALMAKKEGIIIYTVGVGSVSKKDLETLAFETGGQYYHINSFSSLSSIFGQVISDADLYLDSDHDGISDYHEKKIAMNQIRLGSGAILPSDFRMDYQNPDSDGDGLWDGEELEIIQNEKASCIL